MTQCVKKTGSKGTLIQSLQRGLDILELLSKRDTPVGVSEIARETGLKIPTAHNLLRTLFARGYVCQEVGGQRYRLGIPCARLGWAYQQGVHVNDVYKPAVISLSAQLESDVYIAIMEQGSVYFTTWASSGDCLTPRYSEIWEEAGYVNACSHVFLSYLSKEALAAYVEKHPFPKEGREGLKSKRDFEKIKKKCLEDGYVCFERFGKTELAISVPVFDYSKNIVATLSTVFLLSRNKTIAIEDVVDVVSCAAKKISAELGCFL